jgi:hypothetical protein
MGNSCNQIPTLSNTAEIVENESRFKRTPLPSSKFAGCSVLISFLVEFEIYYERGKSIKSPSLISKTQVKYIYENFK